MEYESNDTILNITTTMLNIGTSILKVTIFRMSVIVLKITALISQLMETCGNLGTLIESDHNFPYIIKQNSEVGPKVQSTACAHLGTPKK